MLDYLRHQAFVYRELANEASTQREWEHYWDMLDFIRAEIKRLTLD